MVDQGDDAWTIVDIALLAACPGLGTRLLGEIMAGARAARVPARIRVMRHNADAARL